jgi:ABC-2 type transport system permease protein
MRNIWIIARREYRAYFASPIAYVVAAFILLVVGLIFGLTIYFNNQQYSTTPPGVDMVVSTISTLFIWTLPAITMHLIANETRMGTIELLLTAPVRDWEVIVGKWLGAFLFLLTVIAVTFIYPIMLNIMTDPGIDQGLIVTGYLGLILLTSLLVAIGVLISSLFNNQVATLVATLGVFVVVWFLIYPLSNLGGPGFSEFINYIDVRANFDAMVNGVIELKNLVFFVSTTALFLMFGTVSLESRRWR